MVKSFNYVLSKKRVENFNTVTVLAPIGSGPDSTNIGCGGDSHPSSSDHTHGQCYCPANQYGTYPDCTDCPNSGTSVSGPANTDVSGCTAAVVECTTSQYGTPGTCIDCPRGSVNQNRGPGFSDCQCIDSYEMINGTCTENDTQFNNRMHTEYENWLKECWLEIKNNGKVEKYYKGDDGTGTYNRNNALFRAVPGGLPTINPTRDIKLLKKHNDTKKDNAHLLGHSCGAYEYGHDNFTAQKSGQLYIPPEQTNAWQRFNHSDTSSVKVWKDLNQFWHWKARGGGSPGGYAKKVA